MFLKRRRNRLKCEIKWKETKETKLDESTLLIISTQFSYVFK